MTRRIRMNVLRMTLSLMFLLTAVLAVGQQESSLPAPAKPSEGPVLSKLGSLPPDVQSRLKGEFGSWKVQETADRTRSAFVWLWEPNKQVSCVLCFSMVSGS